MFSDLFWLDLGIVLVHKCSIQCLLHHVDDVSWCDSPRDSLSFILQIPLSLSKLHSMLHAKYQFVTE